MRHSSVDLQITGLAADGFEAVQKAKELRPTLVLMDVGLPGLNGIEAAREIRAHSPECIILFVSEHRGSELIQAAFDIGASGYILKSDSTSDLIHGVRAVVEGNQFVSTTLTNWRDNNKNID